MGHDTADVVKTTVCMSAKTRIPLWQASPVCPGKQTHFPVDRSHLPTFEHSILLWAVVDVPFETQAVPTGQVPTVAVKYTNKLCIAHTLRTVASCPPSEACTAAILAACAVPGAPVRASCNYVLHCGKKKPARKQLTQRHEICSQSPIKLFFHVWCCNFSALLC